MAKSRHLMSRSYSSYGSSRYDWVNPEADNRTKEEAPYGYSAHFLWRHGNVSSLGSSVYSDRLSQHYGDRYDQALRNLRADNPGLRIHDFSKQQCETLLSSCLGRRVVATALAEECHCGNGYPLWIFYFKFGE